MKKLLFLFFAAILLSSSLYSQSNTDNLTFAFSQENMDYLRYLCFENRFDNAAVHYTFGECRVVSGNSTQKLSIRRTIQPNKDIFGATNQGEDITLRDLARTEDFIVPQNGTLQFYRMCYVSNPCTYSGGGSDGKKYRDDPAFSQLSQEDKYWAAGIGTILDQTEWVAEIVSSSTGKKLGVIDSIGVLANPESINAIAYGTSASTSNRSYTFPDFLIGQNVYLRISPRRWGPTPLGLIFQLYFAEYNLSYNMYSVNSKIYFATPSENAIKDILFYNGVVPFFDSLLAANGDLAPGYFNRMHLHGWIADSINKRYYSTLTSNTNFNKLQNDVIEKKLGERKNSHSIINSVYPTPISGNEFVINLNSLSTPKDCKYSITNLNGLEIATGMLGTIAKGESSFKIPLPSNAVSGSYTLNITDASGMIYGNTMIMVAR